MTDQFDATALLPGYRVLDLTSAVGALCGKLLGDLGLDVIKIEPPDGGAARREPPFANGHAHREGSLRFAYLNAGKRSITLDLTKPSGRSLLLQLVERADVIVEDFAPGYLSGLGLSYEALLEKQSKLILVSISGFGQDGPYANYQTHGYVGNAMGGLLYISGDPKMTPCNPPETQSYYYASLFAAYGVMLALWQRETRGIGAWIDTSMQASMALHEHVAFNYSAEGRVMKRAGSQHQHNAPANLFQCKNGWISLFVTQTHWPLLLKVWPDHDPELDDPKWVNSNLRRAACRLHQRAGHLVYVAFSQGRSGRADAEARDPRLARQLAVGFYERPAYSSARVFCQRDASRARFVCPAGNSFYGRRPALRRRRPRRCWDNTIMRCFAASWD